jgi:hypothetical protein
VTGRVCEKLAQKEALNIVLSKLIHYFYRKKFSPKIGPLCNLQKMTEVDDRPFDENSRNRVTLLSSRKKIAVEKESALLLPLDAKRLCTAFMITYLLMVEHL